MSHKNNHRNKAIVWDYWQRMNYAEPEQVTSLIKSVMHEYVNWNGPHPINQLLGVDALITGFWEPLLKSFPDVRRKVHILMGGESDGEEWVSSIGYLTGTFVKDWLGIPANGEKTSIHYGQFYLMREGKVADVYGILDILSVMRQAGFQVLPPSRGAEGGRVPGPRTRDGVLLTEQDEMESRKTGQLMWEMLCGLYRYDRDRDGKNMRSMEQEHYWHPQMHWYGPTGIGACFDIDDFEDFQMRPWMLAFGSCGAPDGNYRKIGLGEGNYLAEGRYASCGLWDAPFGEHVGEYLGVPPTGKLLTMRDFDWYRRDGDYLVENWIPIDLIDLFKQMGVDLFERLQIQVEQRKNQK